MIQNSGIFINNLDELVLQCCEVEKPKNAYNAGLLLNDFQFHNNQAIIVENLNSVGASRALRNWPYDRVELCSSELGRKIAESPGGCYEVFVKSTDEQFKLVEDLIVKKLLENSEYCALAVRNGPKGRVHKHGEMLVRKAAENPRLIYEAGRFWDGGFDKYHPLMIPELLKSAEFVEKAQKDWSDERKAILTEYLIQTVV